MANLYDILGFANLEARLKTVKGVPEVFLAGEQRVEFSTEVVQEFLKMMAHGMRKPGANLYPALDASMSEEEVLRRYQNLRDVALAQAGNDEGMQNFADVLQAYTNQFSQAPDEVPLGVLNAMLDVAAKPEVMELLEKSEALPENLVSGFKNFTDRMRTSLSEDLAESFDKRFETFKSEQNPVSSGFLGDFLTNLDLFRQAEAAPKLGEMIRMEVRANGDLAFAVADDRAKSNRQISQRVKQLNAAYGKSFGKLARSYAHLQFGNESYQAAAAELLKSPEWTKAMADTVLSEVVVEEEGEE